MPQPLTYFRDRKQDVPDWIIPGWLKRRNTGFILGQPKRACKSWLLLNLAWQLSNGLPLWGIHRKDKHGQPDYFITPPRPLRILYFTQEDTEDDIHDRIKLLFASGWQPNDRVWIEPKDLNFSLDTTSGIESVRRSLDRAAPVDLVLFDPMRRMHHRSENESEVIAALWRVLDGIHTTYNCSTIFSHHVVKPPKDPWAVFDPTSPYAARGSGDIYGGGDAFINVLPRAARGHITQYRDLDLHFETKRGQALAPIMVHMDFTTGQAQFGGFLEGRKAQ